MRKLPQILILLSALIIVGAVPIFAFGKFKAAIAQAIVGVALYLFSDNLRRQSS